MDKELAGAAIAFVCALIATPAGMTGAFLLVPIQLSVLGVPAAKVPATNLLFNVISAPAATLRHARAGRIDRSFVLPLLVGSLPGVIVGAVLRARVFTSPEVFKYFVAVVLCVIGLRILFGRREPRDGAHGLAAWQLASMAFVAGVVGAIYGVGGGVLTAPTLVALGVAVASFAPATILVTLICSVVGIVAFTLLATADFPSQPDITLGLAIGAGGLIGSWVGAGLTARLDEKLLARIVGVLTLLLAVRVLV